MSSWIGLVRSDGCIPLWLRKIPYSEPKILAKVSLHLPAIDTWLRPNARRNLHSYTGVLTKCDVLGMTVQYCCTTLSICCSMAVVGLTVPGRRLLQHGCSTIPGGTDADGKGRQSYTKGVPRGALRHGAASCMRMAPLLAMHMYYTCLSF